MKVLANRDSLILSVFSLVILLVSLFWGRDGFLLPFSDGANGKVIFWSLRLPRVLMAFVIGGALGVSGLLFQNLFRNSLASPFTLGVSSGSAFGASLSIFLGLGLTSLFSFMGAISTVFFVYLIGFIKRSFKPTTLILSGVVASFFFSSAILFMFYFSNNLDTKAIVQWTMGSLSIVGYDEFLFIAPIFFITMFFLWLKRLELNVISVGDHFAITRGVDPDKLRIGVFFLISILLSFCVALTGPIAFVGLIIPHITKRIYGADFRDHFFPTLIFSAIFLVLCDWLAHNLLSQVILPVGIITSLLGAPFFLSFLVRSKEFH